jgi:hypothetical protein
MNKNNPQELTDELPSDLRKALIECGALIPTTPNEVEIAEKQLEIRATPAQINASFREIEKALDDPTTEIEFVKLSESLSVLRNEELAMAARNGNDLAEEIRAKIEKSVNNALKKPQQRK